MDYDVLAFIGRFQPFHMGHKAVVDTALTRAKKVGIVIGSDKQPRTARNPFKTHERAQMIAAVYPQEVADGRIHFVPQVDHVYNLQRWIGGVQTGIMKVANTPFTPDPVHTGLIGHSKDHSSFYLKSFPTWDPIEVPNFNNLNATDIRKRYLSGDISFLDSDPWLLPDAVAGWLYDWHHTAEYAAVQAEQAHLTEYAKQFVRPSDAEIAAFLKEHGFTNPGFSDAAELFADAFCPQYPPVFYTADAIVIQSGHILLVQRGAHPGKGLWALPGGFVDRYETSRDAAIRELREETNIALTEDTLKSCISSYRVFEDPYRSQRGRTVTTAYVVTLRDQENLPKIKGGDDAAKAQWVPIANLDREAMFEDHYDIIETMVSL